MVSQMERVSTNSKGTMKMMRGMEREFLVGLLEINIKVTMKATREMVGEGCTGLTEASTWVSG
jgi:hypothetical protein